MLELVNGRFELDPDLMNYPPFKKIWDRDKDKDKAQAFIYISYIFNYNNPKSSYYKNHVTTVRRDRIIEELFPEEMKSVDIDNDVDIQAASDLYVKMLRLSPLRYVLEVAKQVIDDISRKLLVSNKENAAILVEEMTQRVTEGYKRIRKKNKPKKQKVVSGDGSITEETDDSLDPEEIQSLKLSIVRELMDKVMGASAKDEKDKLLELSKLNKAVEEYKKAEETVDKDEINNVKGTRVVKNREY